MKTFIWLCKFSWFILCTTFVLHWASLMWEWGGMVRRPPQPVSCVSLCIHVFACSRLVCFKKCIFAHILWWHISFRWKPQHLSRTSSRETSLPHAVVKSLNMQCIDTVCRFIQIMIQYNSLSVKWEKEGDCMLKLTEGFKTLTLNTFPLDNGP